jgi:integrase
MEVIIMTALEIDRNKYNVVGLNSDSVYASVQTFLSNKRKNSVNTAKAYEPTIHQFFKYAFGKIITEVTWKDMISIKRKDCINFRDFLCDLYAPKKEVEEEDAEKTSEKEDFNESYRNTVNQKMGHLSALLKHFHDENNKVINGIENFKDIKLLYNEEKNSYGTFTSEEMENLIKYAEEQPWKKRPWKPLTQKMFFKLSYITGIRKQTILDLRWDCIEHKLDSKAGKYFWTISVMDKSKEIVQPIDDDIYKELTMLKDAWTTKIDRVFQIDVKTLDDTITKFCEANGINKKEERKCFHSLRKASGDRSLEISGGDIMEAAKHLGDSPETAMRRYLRRNRDLANRSSLQFGVKLNYDVLTGLGEEGLIEIIKSCGFCVSKPIIDKVMKMRATK